MTGNPPPIYLIDLLITNGWVVTMDGERTIVESGAVAIDQGTIVWVGPAADAATVPASEVLDAHGAIIAPGLVDTHFHTGQQLLRGALPGSDTASPPKLPIWKNYLLPFEASLSEEDVYLSARLAYANLLRGGTTCFAEAGGPHPDQMARAALEVGIRGSVALSTFDSDQSGALAGGLATAEAIERNVDLVKRWTGVGDGRVTASLSLRQITVCSEELWRTFADAAEELDCRVHTHLAEGTYEVDFTLER
jgi:5-methylthioadenosine/S-adenosylhomocysteine deaminase